MNDFVEIIGWIAIIGGFIFEETTNRDALVGTGGPAPCRAALPDR